MKLKTSLILRKIVLKILSLWQNIGLVDSVNPKPAILCYHDISSNKWGWTVTPSEFEKQIKHLMRIGCVVTIDEILESRGRADKSNFAITFDDGYESLYKNAFPILEKYNLTATAFVVGDNNSGGLLDGAKMLTKNQIRELMKAGWSIGYHTFSHPDLTKMSDTKLEWEINDIKKKLEKTLNLNFKYFAYPYGKYNKRIKDTLSGTGIRAAFTVNGAGVGEIRDSMEVSRVTIDNNLTLNEFQTLLTDRGIKFNQFYTKFMTIKDKLI